MMEKETLTERVRDSNSRRLSEVIPNPYSERVTLKEIVGRSVAVIGSVAAIYGAVEIARYYHLVDYVRRFF